MGLRLAFFTLINHTDKNGMAISLYVKFGKNYVIYIIDFYFVLFCCLVFCYYWELNYCDRMIINVPKDWRI